MIRHVAMSSTALAVFVGGLWALPVWAQTPPPSPAEVRASGNAGASSQAVQSNRTTVETTDDAQLSVAGATVDSKLSELIQEEGRWLNRVTVIGRARSTNSSQGQLGQVVWYGIKATGEDPATGETIERTAGVRSPLKSSFISQAPVLPGATELQAQGDVESLVEDARRLLAEMDGEAPDTEEEGAGEEEPEEEEGRRGEDRGGGTALPGGQSGNDEARLDRIDIPRREDDSVSRTDMVSTDGCRPRVDLQNLVVVPTAKLVTIEEGTVIAESECTDTAQSFPIQWSYQQCQDAVDLAARRAHAQAQPFYVDDFGQPSYVGECQPVGDETFTIVEDFEACSPRVELDEMRAVQRFSLVYTNRNGVRTVVQGCTDSEDDDAILVLQESADGCSVRHDIPADLSYQQTRLIYVLDNVEHVVRPCSDAGDPMPHIIDAAECDPFVDRATGRATPRGKRLVVLPDGGQQVIAECSPLEDMAQDLTATSEGCEYSFVHDLAARQSLPTWRWFHTLSGSREYVSSCEPSDAPALPHQYQTVGWNNDDIALEAVPVERVFIMPAVGEVEVAGAQVRDGVPAVPYEFVATREAARDTDKYHEGCNAYVPTDLVRQYRRPDTTMMEVVIGEGSIIGPVDECARTTETRNAFLYLEAFLEGNRQVASTAFTLAAGGHVLEHVGRQPEQFDFGPVASCGITDNAWSLNMTVRFSNFFTSQERVRTTLPGGQVTFSSWQNTGSPFVQSGSSCSKVTGDR